MTEIVAAVLWRRLDTEGHDACALQRVAEGWRLDGQAVFDHDGKTCRLSYSVECDDGWRTRGATVHGAVGLDRVTLDIGPGSGEWLLNGEPQPAARGCVDLDLGFTPATNLVAIRRLAPKQDEDTPAPAAYLAFPELRLERLEQIYRRKGPSTLGYSAPAYDYEDVLEVDRHGFVTQYPGLWTGRVSSRDE
ncbi:MAG: putative glycolipid-binding domain-containing protein [Rhizobiaceae bacterium]|nr:putative glycolipid-binding domain-containing protein [Rhizobiaceae bacterium]MCV0407752.1 putative glycolipid-binding domain-containing protein [Rhizobiaceae bacterium]